MASPFATPPFSRAPPFASPFEASSPGFSAPTFADEEVEELSVSLVSVDFYQARQPATVFRTLRPHAQNAENLPPPCDTLDAAGEARLKYSTLWARLDSAPVVRVFGCSSAGQKCCLHVHGVLPYLYARPVDMGLKTRVTEAFNDADRLLAMAPHFTAALEDLANPGHGRWRSRTGNPAEAEDLERPNRAWIQEDALQHRRVIAEVRPVCKVPFYGYHAREEWFLRITLVDPRVLRKVETSLLGGEILRTAFQPYEAHIPYLMQFFMDYNLAGMGMLRLTGPLRFRGPLPVVDTPALTTPHHGGSRTPRRFFGTPEASAPRRPGPSPRALPTPSGASESLPVYPSYALPSPSPRAFKAEASFSQIRQTLDLSQLEARDLEISQDTHEIIRTAQVADHEAIPHAEPTSATAKVPKADGANAAAPTEEAEAEQEAWDWRHSTCEIEVDVIATQILNERILGQTPVDEVAVPNLMELWEEQKERLRKRNPETASANAKVKPSFTSSQDNAMFELLYHQGFTHRLENMRAAMRDLAQREDPCEASQMTQEADGEPLVAFPIAHGDDGLWSQAELARGDDFAALSPRDGVRIPEVHTDPIPVAPENVQSVDVDIDANEDEEGEDAAEDFWSAVQATQVASEAPATPERAPVPARHRHGHLGLHAQDPHEAPPRSSLSGETFRYTGSGDTVVESDARDIALHSPAIPVEATRCVLEWPLAPPRYADVDADLTSIASFPDCENQEAYYSAKEDAQRRPAEFAGRQFVIPHKLHVPVFRPNYGSDLGLPQTAGSASRPASQQRPRLMLAHTCLEAAMPAPRRSDVAAWLTEERVKQTSKDAEARKQRNTVQVGFDANTGRMIFQPKASAAQTKSPRTTGARKPPPESGIGVFSPLRGRLQAQDASQLSSAPRSDPRPAPPKSIATSRATPMSHARIAKRLSVLSLEIVAEATFKRVPDPATSRVLEIAFVLKETYGEAVEDDHEEIPILFRLDRTRALGAPQARYRNLCHRCGSRLLSGCLCGAAANPTAEEPAGHTVDEDDAKPGPTRSAPPRNLRWAEDCLLPAYLEPTPVCSTEALRADPKGPWARGVEVRVFDDERTMLLEFARTVRFHDPDIVLGYEVQRGSLGFLFARGLRLAPQCINLCQMLGRTPGLGTSKKHLNDAWGATTGSDLHVSGRIVLNLWREMRSETKLSSYSLENVVAHVLNRRVPRVEPYVLCEWHKNARQRHRSVRHVLGRASTNLRLVEKLDLLGTTSEMARIMGMDFTSVRTRGSQFRVEAVMGRVVKPLNYAVISPSRAQVASQPSLEVIPLVMEPESRFYTDPVAVLDFQSLYPSLICAYNLCFSTCLGKLQSHVSREPVVSGVGGGADAAGDHSLTMGTLGFMPFHEAQVRNAMQRQLGAEALAALSDEDEVPYPFVAPTGAMFCRKTERVGVLPRMLSEILDTRFMCKKEMKIAKGRGALEKVLFARQFALKMIANVTYGYTSASFSGRMPMAELADTIVACGRRTLENAMKMVEANPRWRAKVVYGDTDSMFVLLKGRSRAQAFTIGAEIAAAVTAANPTGVVLKFEKVYHPCILPVKKRYVGHMFESPSDTQPVLEAKGIEIVRRDQCLLTQKLQERCLETLFRTRDLSEVRRFLLRQLRKILRGGVRGSLFVLCKEVRLGSYKSETAVPPQAVVAQRRMQWDPRNEPRHKERVPFIVVCGSPGSLLRENVVAPEELFQDLSPYRINYLYYVTKQVLPPLDRLLSLVGADVFQWFCNMPKPRMQHAQRAAAVSIPEAPGRALSTMMKYMKGDRCRFCNAFCKAFICEECRWGATESGEGRAVVLGNAVLREAETRARATLDLCGHCLREQHLQFTAAPVATSFVEGPSAPRVDVRVSAKVCSAVDCPVFYERHHAHLQHLDAQAVVLHLHRSREERGAADAEMM